MRTLPKQPMTFTSAALSQWKYCGPETNELHVQDTLPGITFAGVKGTLRVLLADDHEMLRVGAATFLQLHLGCVICAQASDGREALKLAESTRPDVAVIDLGLPGLNGLDLTSQIRRLYPETEVVVLTGDNSIGGAQKALAAGAKAFILKLDAIAYLAEAVQMAGEHRFYLTPDAHDSLRQKTSKPRRRRMCVSPPVLTSREREAVQLLAEGKSNKEVAGFLGISVKTVEAHRANIMRKLGLARLSELVRYAIRKKIIHA